MQHRSLSEIFAVFLQTFGNHERQPTGAIGRERAPNFDPNRGLTPFAPFLHIVMPHLLLSYSPSLPHSPHPRLGTFGIQTRKGPGGGGKRGPLARLSKGRSCGGAREQHQRSSRQINLRRDLRSGTSLSAYIRVYTCARAPAGLACAWPDRTGAGYIVHRE